jgi:hypothetical protein
MFQEKAVQDELGLYYNPILENKKIRMYVQSGSDNIEFRMWNADDPGMWDDHGWVEWPAIQQAADFYKKEGRGKPPLHLYDIEIAERLLKDSLLIK